MSCPGDYRCWVRQQSLDAVGEPHKGLDVGRDAMAWVITAEPVVMDLGESIFPDFSISEFPTSASSGSCPPAVLADALVASRQLFSSRTLPVTF